jgi:predicted nucleic acid-binding Zn ribbon protein
MATHNRRRPKSKPKPKTDLLAVSKVLQTLLANGKSPLSDQFLRWKIWRFWPQIVGETLGRVCEPVGFDRGRLFIWVKSSPRMQEIRFFEDQLKTKVNEHVGRSWCRDIRFTLDRRGIPKEAEVSEEFKAYLAGEEGTRGET